MMMPKSTDLSDEALYTKQYFEYFRSWMYLNLILMETNWLGLLFENFLFYKCIIKGGYGKQLPVNIYKYVIALWLTVSSI